jgi:hypothetical protein
MHSWSLQSRHVASTSRPYVVGNLPSARGLESFDPIEHGVAGTGPQIDGKAFRAVKQTERGHMPSRQIHDVNVISDPSAIVRVVIAAPDIELFTASDRNLSNKWNKIVGDAFRIFTN